MTMHVKTPDGWKIVREQWLKSGGTLKDIEGMWYKYNGTWRQFFTPLRAQEFHITISANTLNYNLYNTLATLGWDTQVPVVVTVHISAGVIVGSSSTAAYAFSTGSSYPTGSSLRLEVDGTIMGGGGRGGNGTQGDWIVGDPLISGSSGFAGGPALFLGLDTTLVNEGIIGGGGGGGGGGGSGNYDEHGYPDFDIIGGSGGGGGRGQTPGIGGGSWESSILGYNPPGKNATTAAPGAASNGYGYRGGAGGNLGQNGVAGTNGNQTPGFTGGLAGNAIVGISFATVSGAGSILGVQV